jgi:hypothetical protein
MMGEVPDGANAQPSEYSYAFPLACFSICAFSRG